jgi:hypothetical protein
MMSETNRAWRLLISAVAACVAVAGVQRLETGPVEVQGLAMYLLPMYQNTARRRQMQQEQMQRVQAQMQAPPQGSPMQGQGPMNGHGANLNHQPQLVEGQDQNLNQMMQGLNQIQGLMQGAHQGQGGMAGSMAGGMVVDQHMGNDFQIVEHEQVEMEVGRRVGNRWFKFPWF